MGARRARSFKGPLLAFAVLWLLSSIAALWKRVRVKSDTLVVFGYFECGPVCRRDLEYFMNVALWENSGADYIIVVNGPCSICKNSTANGMSNVRFIQRENRGFDFGAYAEAIDSVNIEDYRYFVFLNAGVRGPFLPRHDLGSIKYWHKRFTNLLVDDVKLVGPTISCEQQIHVQSYCFALEREGLEAAFSRGAFPHKAASIDDLIHSSEFGMTNAVMESGFSIDSLMLEYASVDWKALWKKGRSEFACNARLNPTISQWYHKQDLQVFEAMFYKIGGSMRRFCPQAICSYDAPIELATDSIEAYVNKHRAQLAKA